jgi:glycosyltransferase involved in cell wall biosynthesis
MEEEIVRRRLPGVHVAGLLRGAELSAAFASADLFVFPSTTETFGNSLLEAMASGLPAIAAGAGGVLEFARDGVNCRVAAPESAPALADAIAELLADPAERARLAAGALDTARARDWDRIYDDLVEGQYRPVAQGGAGRRAA